MKKINGGLLILAAITSVIFLHIVESFNDITLDDLGFALLLHKESLWKFIIEIYLTWQGRFMGFLMTGLQMKSYFLFNSMMPFSVVLYIVNIFLVSKAMTNFFSLKPFYSALLAIILFQIYIYSMLDISSYFWLCTRGYTLIISLSLFAFSILFVSGNTAWYDYPVLLITFAFLGCSNEIFSPVLIFMMSCVLLYKFHKSGYKIGSLVSGNRKLVFSLAVAIVFFLLMVVAPGNLIRMSVHAKDSDLVFSDYILAAGKTSIHLAKLLFLKIHYFLAAGIILFAVHQQVNTRSTVKENVNSLKRILLYTAASVTLYLLSVLLNTYAVGAKVPLRAFNHANLICFLFIGFSLYEYVTSSLMNKLIIYGLPLSLMFVIFCNVYNTCNNIPELRKYRDSVNIRMARLEMLRSVGNIETIKLESLNPAEFHSVDDLWKFVIPRYSHRILLKPNEVSNSTAYHYNKAYREYYKLDFDVVTDLLISF